jgi:glycosyltransferase involved in cell wall biosynthesis
MNLAILHYHLRPGGVTTVIRNSERALARRHEVRVLAGFDYDDGPSGSRRAFIREAGAISRKLRAEVRGADVLHAHNLTLGKNPRLTFAVKLLAESGVIRVIHQVHDFPEENRPAQLRALRSCTGERDDLFWKEMCYYDLPNVLWATLTRADKAKLAARGVPERKIHVLPNPVDDASFGRPAPPEPALSAIRGQLAEYARAHRYTYDPERRVLLSPMKVMVRKNNSEAVGLVRRLGDYQLLITLDASSPADRAYSEELHRRVRRERLPVVMGFGVSLDDPLPLFHMSHAILTTSRQEGFGYTFLEGWLCGKLVVGRDIPEVTADFRSAGVDLGHLYREPDARAIERMRRLLSRPPRRLVEHNRAVVLDQYSLRAYARRYAHLIRRFPRRHGGADGH